MDNNIELAGEKSVHTGSTTFRVDDDGFEATLYRPEEDRYPGRVLIFVGGSDGTYDLPKIVARAYADAGMTGLALAYWNHPGLPQAISHVPLEYVGRAATRLRVLGYQRVGMWGISMGSLLALLCGAYLPELVSCVIAVSPGDVCTQAMTRGKVLPGSAFSFRGKDLPWMPPDYHKGRVVRDFIRGGSLSMRSCYVHKDQAPADAFIPVEKIEGPVLLQTPESDSMWPSRESCDAMMARLDAAGFAYPHECVSYKYASHFLVPAKLRSARLFRIERRHPEECWESDWKSLADALQFVGECW